LGKPLVFAEELDHLPGLGPFARELVQLLEIGGHFGAAHIVRQLVIALTYPLQPGKDVFVHR